jgi:hypothetical protein
MAHTTVLVSGLITAAFAEAARRLPQLHERWIHISHAVGGSIPGSLLSVSIQRDGWLDMVLRCMEDERAVYGQAATEGPGLFTFNYQMNLSELWIGSMYETLRMLKERKLMAPAMRAPRRCAATRPMSSANLLSKPRSSNPRSHRPLN